VTEQEQIFQLVGMGLAAIIGGWVASDATRRGLKTSSAFGWGVGVFFALILFLPLYLYMRKREGWGIKDQPGASPATKECPYCGYQNVSSANYCAKCDRQLKSSNEIHHKKS
jgi:hypothetical protein